MTEDQTELAGEVGGRLSNKTQEAALKAADTILMQAFTLSNWQQGPQFIPTISTLVTTVAPNLENISSDLLFAVIMEKLVVQGANGTARIEVIERYGSRADLLSVHQKHIADRTDQLLPQERQRVLESVQAACNQNTSSTVSPEARAVMQGFIQAHGPKASSPHLKS